MLLDMCLIENYVQQMASLIIRANLENLCQNALLQEYMRVEHSPLYYYNELLIQLMCL